MFIVDFDDTLFDTQRYHRERLAIINDLGIDQDLYWKTYQECRLDDQGRFVYNEDRHAQKLSEHGFEKKDIVAKLAELKERAVEFLFDDAHSFLQGLKALGQPIFLLSWGAEDFQRTKKVEPSGIVKYFDQVFYTAEPKEVFLKSFLTGKDVGSVWFINDKPSETKRLADLFPSLLPVLKVSPAFPITEYTEGEFPYFQTLTEIKEYVFERAK